MAYFFVIESVVLTIARSMDEWMKIGSTRLILQNESTCEQPLSAWHRVTTVTRSVRAHVLLSLCAQLINHSTSPHPNWFNSGGGRLHTRTSCVSTQRDVSTGVHFTCHCIKCCVWLPDSVCVSHLSASGSCPRHGELDVATECTSYGCWFW